MGDYPHPDNKLEIAISHQKNSSPGHDKISLQSINHLPIKAINLLLKSFNDSWSSSQIPKDDSRNYPGRGIGPWLALSRVRALYH
ncbi:hypothetical protein TNCV_2470081 [Trichonephila clavipes]|nr:hypothetical protein TNCV_2470081 [Trichonephila clavipes]